MGNNMRARLKEKGVEVTGYDPESSRSPTCRRSRRSPQALPEPRIVWVMVPSGKITDDVIHDLAGVLGKGDLDHRRRQLALHR